MWIVDEVESVMNHPHRQLQSIVVTECLDATDYFNWDSTNAGENLLRLHYECTCSGDFGSAFSMVCVLDNHCFDNSAEEDVVSIAQNNNSTVPPVQIQPIVEQCVSRSFSYDFVVDTTTGELFYIARFVSTDVFESGFGFEGNFTAVNYNPCRIELQLEHDYEMEDAIATCNNRTTCEAFFNANTTLTSTQIDYICPKVLYNGVECQEFNLLACEVYDTETQTRFVAMPDCSNVNPCLTSSCQAFPRIDTKPERFLFRYPECDDSDNNDPTNDNTTAPSQAPSMMMTTIPDNNSDNNSSSSMPSSAPTVLMEDGDDDLDLCTKAIEYLGTTENLEENYDCACATPAGGDSLVLDCSIQDYCFLDKNAASLEYCVNHNITFSFTFDLATNDIVEITRAEACTDFLQNGPIGRLCRNDWSICRLVLYDVLVDLDDVMATCLDRPTCIETVQDLLNYTLAQAEYLCPSATLNGQECNSVGYGDCGEQDFDNNLFFRTMPDCSNVESCATSTCQTAVVRDPTPQRFMETFPQCGLPSTGGGGGSNGNGGGDATPTNNPTASPGDVAPGDTLSASAAHRVGFEHFLGSILLCATVAASLFSR